MMWVAIYFLINVLLAMVIYSKWHTFKFKNELGKSENARLIVSVVYILLGLPLLLLGIVKTLVK